MTRYVAPWCISMLPTLTEANCASGAFCEAIGRQNCDPARGTACGSCTAGTEGSWGPANTRCLRSTSCAMIFPAQNGCPATDGSGTLSPLVVPFNKCVCDSAGRFWPTAPNMCATLVLDKPGGTGIYTLRQCWAKNCDPKSCLDIGSWSPEMVNPATPAEWSKPKPFACGRWGSDSLALSNDCKLLDDMLPGQKPYDSLCGHPGMRAKKPIMGVPIAHHEDCELAPKCPSSVLDKARLAESCCEGTDYSNPLEAWGKNVKVRAPGFCSMANKVKSAMSPTGASNPSLVAGIQANGQECLVRTEGPGWRGCSCLDERGLPDVRLICTVECEPPDCARPDGGIPKTPEDWLTSEVPQFLFPPDKSKMLQAARTAALPQLTMFAALFALLTLHV